MLGTLRFAQPTKKQFPIFGSGLSELVRKHSFKHEVL